MSLTPDDLAAIGVLIDERLGPLATRLENLRLQLVDLKEMATENFDALSNDTQRISRDFLDLRNEVRTIGRRLRDHDHGSAA